MGCKAMFTPQERDAQYGFFLLKQMPLLRQEPLPDDTHKAHQSSEVNKVRRGGTHLFIIPYLQRANAEGGRNILGKRGEAFQSAHFLQKCIIFFILVVAPARRLPVAALCIHLWGNLHTQVRARATLWAPLSHRASSHWLGESKSAK